MVVSQRIQTPSGTRLDMHEEISVIRSDTPKFDSNQYARIALNDLVTYSVYFLSQSGDEITAEDIVAACFLLFPKRFELRGYPQWPDSTVVNKRWIDCRNKDLIKGSTADGFKLTPKGLKIAERVGDTLRVQGGLLTHRSKTNKVRAETRTRAGRFVKALEESAAYKQYLASGKEANIGEFDFRSMLLCTLDTSPNTLRSNLEQFRQYVVHYDRQDLLNFLMFCEVKFAKILMDRAQQAKAYQGGMLKKKLS
jgi:hypothetical protein